MDDKTFEYLEKILAEVQDTKNHVKTLDNRLTKIEITLENDVKPKIDILIDEVSSIKEKLVEHDSRFDVIESKIESQDVEIKVLKRAK